jgi:hypothetical protein
VPSAHFRLQTVLAHQTSDLLMIDDHPSMAHLGAHPPPAVAFKLAAGRGNGVDDCCVVDWRWRGVM